MKRARLNKKGLAKFQNAGEFKKELRPIGSREPKKPITLQGMSGMSLQELDKLKEAYGLHKSDLTKTKEYEKYEYDWKDLKKRQQAFVTRIGDKYRRPAFNLYHKSLGSYMGDKLFDEISSEDSAEFQSLLDEEMDFSSLENSELWEEMDWRDWHSDEIRHAYSSAATANKVSDALSKIPGYGGVLEYTGMNDVLGFLASNVLGAGHEAAFFKEQMGEEEDKYDYVRSGMNSAEDMWNNLLGSYIGVTSDSEEEMEQKIKSYINKGITATGQIEPAQDPNTLGIKKALKNWVTNNSSDLEPAFEEYQKGGSMSTAQRGSLAEDVIGQIRMGVSAVKVYKDLLRQMIPADEIDNAFTQAGYDQNTITQLQRQASKSITDEMVDTSIAERGIRQAKSGRELLNKRKRLPKYQDLGEFPDPTGKLEAEYDQVNLKGEEMDDMNYQPPVIPFTASGSVGVNIPASSVATVTDVTPVTPVVEEQTQPQPEVAEKDIAYNPFGSDMASVEMADATPENEARMLKEMEEFRNIGAEPGGLRGFAGKVGDFVKSEGFQNFLDGYGTVGNVGVGLASMANKFLRDREARDAKNQRRQMTPADMMYSMYEERDGDRGNVDVRSSIYQPDNLVAAMGMEMPSMMPPVIQEQIVDLDTETITRLISAGADIEML